MKAKREFIGWDCFFEQVRRCSRELKMKLRHFAGQPVWSPYGIKTSVYRMIINLIGVVWTCILVCPTLVTSGLMGRM